MAEDHSENLPRVTDITDYVIKRSHSYDDLNAGALGEGENKYREILEKQVNSSTRWEPFAKAEQYPNLFQGYDDQGRELQFILKIVRPSENAADIEEVHKKHVQLLGPEFVEDMTRIKITNPNLVKQIKERAALWKGFFPQYPESQTEFEAFVQDKRSKTEGQNLWIYIIDHRSDMPPAMRTKILTFLQRVIAGIEQGYVFDLDIFPNRLPTGDSKREEWNNAVVDKEGPAIIDSGSIWTIKQKQPFAKEIVLSAQVATSLLKDEVSLEEAFEKMKY